MTFDEIVATIMDRLNLTSPEATTRIGTAVNVKYRRVTSSIGLQVARRKTDVPGTTTPGSANVTFTGIEKIERILDTRSGTFELDETTFDEIRGTNPSASDNPKAWAVEKMGPSTVLVRLDVLAQTAFSLYADGLETAATLSGAQVPQFNQDFHDILVEGVLADELRKQEKLADANVAKADYDTRLSELRFFIAKSGGLALQQNGSKRNTLTGSSVGGGSGAAPGAGTNYTQTGQILFDRDPAAPFAVSVGSDYVPNLRADKVHVSATDKLVGRDTAGAGDSEELAVSGGLEFTGAPGIQRSALTGDVTAAAGSNATTIAALAVTAAKLAADAVTDVKVAAAAAIAWTKISKSGSSLADLATRSATDLTSGTVAAARLGSGTLSVANVLRGNNTWGDAPGLTTDGASAVQNVQFRASQVASANANALDDYEEGTWTPADGSGGGLVLTLGTCQYIKIGQMVIAWFDITFPVTGGGANAAISGLPFTSQSVITAGGYLAFSNYSASVMTISVASGATSMNFGNTGGASLTNTDLVSRSLRGCVIYRASA